MGGCLLVVLTECYRKLGGSEKMFKKKGLFENAMATWVGNRGENKAQKQEQYRLGMELYGRALKIKKLMDNVGEKFYKKPVYKGPTNYSNPPSYCPVCDTKLQYEEVDLRPNHGSNRYIELKSCENCGYGWAYISYVSPDSELGNM